MLCQSGRSYCSQSMSHDAQDQAAASRVFREVIGLLEEGGFDYAVGGGLATDHWTGGAHRIGDIDVVVSEADTDEILQALSSFGFETTKMDHSWLHKAHKDGVTIDLMFELKNQTRIDESFLAHRERGEMFGTTAYVMAAEDQVASLAATLSRDTIGNHWYSIIDLMSNNDLEWDYVVARSRPVPLRMLSLVYFALEERVPVAEGVIEQLAGLINGADDGE